jgi:hypothetical protein
MTFGIMLLSTGRRLLYIGWFKKQSFVRKIDGYSRPCSDRRSTISFLTAFIHDDSGHAASLPAATATAATATPGEATTATTG